MTIEELFGTNENKTLTYDEFVEGCTKNNLKLVNLTDGNYVSKQKFDNEIATRENTITDLTTQLSGRDTDLQALQDKLTNAENNSMQLDNVTQELTNLQTKYENDTKEYQQKLKDQEYSFAVKDFANSKKFTSNAAKRDFISCMMDKKLVMENGNILGANDFVTEYSKENSDAFVVEKPDEPSPNPPAPHFIAPTGDHTPAPQSAKGFHFNFSHLREKN